MLGQRDKVPFNRGPRRKDSTGGANQVLIRRTLVDGMEGESTRFPGTINDTTISRIKTPWFSIPTYIPAGQSWVNWTEAGPVRPELHMRNYTMRTMEGTSATRFLPNPRDPRQGLHTDPKVALAVSAARVRNGLPRMTTARQDRLRSGQYTGQSYSQTTRIQGAR